MSPIERDVAQFTWYDETTPERRTRFDDYLRSAGVAAEVATVVLKQQDYLRAMTRPLPASIELIAPGGTLQHGRAQLHRHPRAGPRRRPVALLQRRRPPAALRRPRAPEDHAQHRLLVEQPGRPAGELSWLAGRTWPAWR
jgi:hypothetical protein